LLADLGMSSMQVDDPERGFSYARDGPLDMRMDRTRGRSAAHLLASLPSEDLARALREWGDEPEADRIASLLGAAARAGRLHRTSDAARLLHGQEKTWRLRPAPDRWNSHPAVRTFQALRILVNRELANLEQLLRVLPHVLKPGGRAAIISFHSGEDRLVEAGFPVGLHASGYGPNAPGPGPAPPEEWTPQPPRRTAPPRWARRPGIESSKCG